MTKEEFLAMSLPYGLYIQNGEEADKIVGIMGDSIMALFRGHLENTWHIDDVKPILLPLSDLTKTIEHNGETFVPIEKLNEMFGYEECKLVYYINSGLRWSIDSGFCSTAITFSDMYLPIQKLIEWKFDLFKGIKNKEAIDVNTLDINPYK